jgi:hypothetical protein
MLKWGRLYQKIEVIGIFCQDHHGTDNIITISLFQKSFKVSQEKNNANEGCG